MSDQLVKDIMSKDCVTVTLLDNVFEIALKMKQHDIGFVGVLDGDTFIGGVTDRDLVIRGYAEKHSGSTAVETVMTKGMTTVAPNTTVDEAAKIMAQHQIRRLPVIDNGKLVGIVAIGDLAIRGNYEDEAGEALSQISKEQTLVGSH